MMQEFKTLVTRSAHVARERHSARSRVGPARIAPPRKRRPGLLLAYEKTGYDKTGPGRLPDLLDEWSVRRLKENGADCIKILLYYTPFDPKDVNDKKHAWVERIGDECRANDIPFFLSSSATKRAPTKRGSSSRRRSRKSLRPRCASSRKTVTAWTS
jgi:tagatose 1,6-diphosphate aldolase